MNSRLSSHGSSTSLSENLPTYVRWGVGLPVALELLGNGLGSRSLAMRIAHAHRNEHADTREWLRGLSTLSWTELLATDPSETRILLKFVRSQSSGLLSRIQRYGSAEIAMVVDGQLNDGAIVSCSVVNGDELMPIEVRSNDQRLGTIRSQDQLDALELLRSDIDFSAKIKYGGSSPVLAFSLADHQ